jgi:hypothetical protein
MTRIPPNAKDEPHGNSQGIATAMRSGIALLASFVLGAAASAQERYPDPFPGGYPSVGGQAGGGKMYMESYYLPVVTSTPA